MPLIKAFFTNLEIVDEGGGGGGECLKIIVFRIG